MLKNPARLPLTMLWFSNGGRFYAPWNGRHRHVLGVEDGCTCSLYGHAASIAPNEMNAIGIPTSISLDPHGRVDVRHVIGAVPAPPGWTRVRNIRQDDGVIVVRDAAGETLSCRSTAASSRRAADRRRNEGWVRYFAHSRLSFISISSEGELTFFCQKLAEAITRRFSMCLFSLFFFCWRYRRYRALF